MRRNELLQALRVPRTIEHDEELAREAIEMLRESFSPELVDAIESAFGLPVNELDRRLKGHSKAEELNVTNPWLGAYLKLTADSESPQHFHCMAALSVAGALWGTSAWVNLGYCKVYPPMAVLLVGPSGVRKSAAISAALALVPESGLTVFRDRFTLEGIIAGVRQGSRVLMVASEFAAAFGRAKYLEDSVPVVTRMLDQEGIEYTTKTAGKFKVTDVAFGLLAASTVDWIVSGLPQSAASGGFLGRFLIPYAAHAPKCVYRADDNTEKLKLLGESLMVLTRSTRGELNLTLEADAWLSRWYRSFHGENFSLSSAMSSYYNRRLVHLVRIALVLALVSGSSCIGLTHVKDAYKVLKLIEPGHLSVLAEVAGASTYRDLVTLLSSVTRNRVSKEVLTNVGVLTLGLKRFREAISVGINMGVVVPTGGSYSIVLSKAPEPLRKLIASRREHDSSDSDGVGRGSGNDSIAEDSEHYELH